MRLNIRYEHDIPVNAFQWTPKTILEPLHYHSSLEIGWCLSGRGIFHFGRKSFSVDPGDVFIVNNSELHIAQSLEHDPCTFIFVNFDPGLLLEDDERLLLPFCYSSDDFSNHVPTALPLARELTPLIQRIWMELADKHEGYRSMVKGTLLQLCTLLLRHHSSRFSEVDWKRQGNAFRELRSLLAYMEEHYTERIELKDLAKRIGVSPSRASHRFLEATGRGFKDYLLQLRLNEARRQLIGSDLPVTEVCFGSGFQSIPSFYRLFAEAEGMSPMDYRRKYEFIANSENSSPRSKKQILG